MPDDTASKVLWTVGPAVASVAGGFVIGTLNRDTISWWSSLKKPSWAPRSLGLYSAVDCGTLCSLGYGSYLVQKGGTDKDDVKLALGLYAATYAAAHSSWPAIFNKNMKWMAVSAVCTTGCAAATAYAFTRVNKDAGMFAVPYCLWLAFYVALTTSMLNEDSKKND